MDPCSLHIALGLVVNAMGGSMLRRTGEAIVRSVLYGPANITINPFNKGEIFKEMNARRCLRCDRSKWDDETYPPAEYRSLLVLLNEIYRTIFMVQFGFSKDVREMRVFITNFVDSVNSVPHLEFTEALKHIFSPCTWWSLQKKYLATSCKGE